MNKLNEKDLQGPRELRNSLLFCNLGPQLLSVLVHLWTRGLSVGVGRVPPSFHKSFTRKHSQSGGLVLTSLDLLAPCCGNSMWYLQPCQWWWWGGQGAHAQ